MRGWLWLLFDDEGGAPTPVHYLAPSTHVLRVPAEQRHLAVRAEHRVLAVPAEGRRATVNAEHRRLPVPAEQRRLKVKE